MIKDGKPLEKTIQLIEETFKDSNNTQIFRNYKMKDNDGVKREFDVLIKTIVNGYEMYIAIECKDYGTKVSIDKIDSFKTKCDSIKEISKKIFVSKNGFQKGAETKAKTYGIELITAEEVSNEYLNELMPNISQYQLEISKTNLDHKITIGSNNPINLEDSKHSYQNEIFEYISGKKRNIHELMKISIEVCLKIIDEKALKHYVTYKDTLEQNPGFPITIGLEIPPMRFYFKDKDSNKIDVTKLEFEVDVKFHPVISENSGRVIKLMDDSIKAHSIIFKIDDSTESELILKPDNKFSFYHTKNKETVEFKTLSKYDSKTNQIISYKKENSNEI